MFKILIADDDYEDRELLKLEIQQTLDHEEPDLRFYEAASIRQATELLKTLPFDLLTLDIEFDRMHEGLHALPEIFEQFPSLNIIIISGKLNKSEVTEELFRFTKDNVLKGKRWARHFDVLDKKDDKTAALQRAYSFASRQKGASEKVRDLFLLAESYLDRDEMDKCIEVYRKIQSIIPGEVESDENIRIFHGVLSPDYALEYFHRGEKVVASLLLGHYLETRLKAFTRKKLGRHSPGLYDCLSGMERVKGISPFKKSLFLQIIRLRNKAIHHPTSLSEKDFDDALKDLKLLEAKF